MLSALYGQRSSYNNCAGAVFAPIDGSFSLSFLGEKKQNQMWLVFIAPKSGKFQLNINSISASLTISKGIAYISNEEWCDLTSQQKSQADSISFELRGQHLLKDIELEKNQYVTICVETPARLKDDVLFKSAFVGTRPSEDEQILSFIYNDTLPVYTLVLRDGQTRAPISGRISLQGAPEINGSYFASQLSINLKQPLKKGFIKVEVPGYFPVEYKEQRIPLGATYIDTIYLSGFKAGELTKLEQVYFSAGLPEIMEESYAQLNRLRDLLLLNPQINIEIHGHVNLDENGAKKAQKLSKQRAEMVKDYLVQNGVAAKRLYPIGFGSSKPVYSKPKDEEEKEANRRVEILIKDN
jgi:outer membrane protein OmpA-like peptidoglycan-associated protein